VGQFVDILLCAYVSGGTYTCFGNGDGYLSAFSYLPSGTSKEGGENSHNVTVGIIIIIIKQRRRRRRRKNDTQRTATDNNNNNNNKNNKI
jgi:hypothetical protein